jgi:hypothetical protein
VVAVVVAAQALLHRYRLPPQVVAEVRAVAAAALKAHRLQYALPTAAVVAAAHRADRT